MARSRLGEYYVQIVPVLHNIDEQITKQILGAFDDVAEEVSEPAEKIGEEIGEGAGGGAAKKMGAAIVAGLAALKIGEMIGNAINSGLDQIDIGNKTAAALNLSTEEAERVAEATSSLYKQNYGESYEAVAEVMRSIVGSVKGAREASAEELERMAKDVINLGDTFGIESGQINSAVQSMMGSGLTSSWDESVALIVSGYQTMGASGEDWIDTLNEYSDDFKKLGFDANEAMNFVNAGLEAGVLNTDKMADALNEVSIRLQDGTANDFLEQLGFDPAQISADVKEGGDAAQTAIMNVLSKLQSDGNLEQWAGIFGTMAEDFQIAFQTMDLSSLNNEIGDSTELLKEFDETLNGGPNASLGVFQRTVEQTFTEMLIPILELVNPPLQAMAIFLSENEGAAMALGVVIGGVLLAGLVLATAALWGMAAAGFAAMAPFLPIIGIILAVVAAIGLIGVAIWALVENWDVVIGFLSSAWDGFVGFISDTVTLLADAFVGLGKGIANYFIWSANVVIGFINWMIDAINSIHLEAPDWLGGGSIGFDLQKVPEVAYLADGGTIPARPGGTLSVLGEAGRSEVVMDEGKWNSLIDSILAGDISAGSQGNIIFQIYQQPGQDPEELVQMIDHYIEMNSLKPAGA